jgi:PAS domain S-box-containing protein
MATRRPYLDAALSGQETRFEMLWTLPDGSTRDAEARYLPRFGPDGTVEGLFLFVADITDRKAAERRLVATNVALEERVEARTRERDQIWQISKDMLCIATQDGYLVNLNPAWSDTLGWSLEQLMSEPFISFVHPDDIETTNQAAAKLARGEPALDFENRYRHADGGWRWLSWNAVPDGALIYAIVRDVSEAKAATERERSLEEALRQAQKMEAVGQLTGGLAHDFNNLLTGITGSLDMMSRRVEQGRTGELARYVDAAQAAAKRAAALTHRLLAFSRRQTLDPKPTDVDALVAGLEELVRRTVGPQIAVEIAAAAGVWSVLVDPNQLENALLNLCINARDAMPDGGRLVISTTNLMLDEDRARTHELQPGAYVALGVSDTGTGMAPDVIERIFDPFFTTKPIGQGTGLGLSMIYGFARQSGGQVMVESQLERGTTMTLLLPRWFGRSEHAAAPAEAKAVSTTSRRSACCSSTCWATSATAPWWRRTGRPASRSCAPARRSTCSSPTSACRAA